MKRHDITPHGSLSLSLSLSLDVPRLGSDLIRSPARDRGARASGFSGKLYLLATALAASQACIAKEQSMELSEIYADESGETHFRRTELALEPRDFAPPSKPLMVSAEITLTTGRFLVAPPGWDDAYHATPRKQLAFVLSGSVTVTATDGESIVMRPGDLLLLNDTNSKGHLTRVQGQADHCALMIGLKDDGT